MTTAHKPARALSLAVAENARTRAASATNALYVAAARAHFDAAHAGHSHDPERVAELVQMRAADPAFRAAVDTACAQATALLRRRFAALLGRAAGLDPRNAGRVAVFLRDDLPLTLGENSDPEHPERQAAMRTGRHPAGRRGVETVEATLDRISREAPGWQPLPEPA